MQIMLVLVILAVFVALACLVAAGVSLAIGIGAAAFRPSRAAAPIFLFILPLSAIGALVGCFGIGWYLITQANENLLLWGPAIGFFAGGAIGCVTGLFLAVSMWLTVWRCGRPDETDRSHDGSNSL